MASLSLESHFNEIQTMLEKLVKFTSGIELAVFFTDKGLPISCVQSSATIEATELQTITTSIFSTTKRVVKELGKGITQTITVKASNKFLFIRKIGNSSDDSTSQTTLALLSNMNVHIGILLDFIEEIAEELLKIMEATGSNSL